MNQPRPKLEVYDVPLGAVTHHPSKLFNYAGLRQAGLYVAAERQRNVPAVAVVPIEPTLAYGRLKEHNEGFDDRMLACRGVDRYSQIVRQAFGETTSMPVAVSPSDLTEELLVADLARLVGDLLRAGVTPVLHDDPKYWQRRSADRTQALAARFAVAMQTSGAFDVYRRPVYAAC